MSAQLLLSMIAPALPAPPQGAVAGDGASAFEGLLAAMMGSVVANDDITEEVVAGAADGSGADVAATVMIAAPPPPVALIADAPVAEAPPAASPALPLENETPTPLPPPSDADVKADAPPVTKAQPEALAPATTPVSVPTEAVEAATAAIARPARVEPRSEDTTPPPPVTPQPTGRTAAEASPAQPPVAPAQPALRPLAERTSRPLASPTGTEGSMVADPRSSGASTSTSVATQAGPSVTSSDTAARPAEFVAAIVPDAAATTQDEATGEGALPEQTSAAPAIHTAREAASPTISRAAVEATAQIAAQIQRKLEGRNTRFEMALTPDELGRVDVKLDIDSEGRLSARLAFDNPAAAADLRGKTDELRRQLEQAGFHVADDAFEFTDRDSGSSAFDRGQDARDGQGRAFARANRLTLETDAVALAPRWTNLSLAPAGVDLKV